MTSIRKRSWQGADGAPHQAWVVDYRDQAGKRRSRQFARKKEADAFALTAAHEVRTGRHTADRESVTVAKAADLWIERAEREGLERSTVKSYRELARLHIVPLIGSQRLSRLTRPAVEQYRDDLIASRSRAMASKAVRALAMIIGEAERLGLVAHNPASAVRVTQASRSRDAVTIPPAGHLKALLAAANDDDRAFVMLAIATGLRSSELRGLRWVDVDTDAKLIHVRQRADSWGVIGPPKSAAGRRTVPIPAEVSQALAAHQARHGHAPFVFARGRDAHTHMTLLKSLWNPLQTRAGLVRPPTATDGPNVAARPIYGLHALRHAAASAWIAAGVDLKRLQSWLGHSTIQMTLDRYGHLLDDRDRDAALIHAASRSLFGALAATDTQHGVSK